MHPGVELETDPDLTPKDVSLLVVRISDLLIRSSRSQADSMGIYIYDKNIETPQFLGAAQVAVSEEVTGMESSDVTYSTTDTIIEQSVGFLADVKRVVELLPEMELDELIMSLEDQTLIRTLS
jgi:hypothetical protein